MKLILSKYPKAATKKKIYSKILLKKSKCYNRKYLLNDKKKVVVKEECRNKKDMRHI